MRHLIHDLSRALRLVVLLVRWGTVPLLRRMLRLPVSDLSVGYRFRRLIEGMGTSFIKLGQFLASRFDVLPPEVCQELDLLFDTAPTLPFRLIRKRIEEELHAPLERLFSSFDEKPLAAASIAQVHSATALDGERVAVKVQRPGIEQLFRSDMRLLRRFAGLLDMFRLLGRIPIVSLVDEFTFFTLREMDFVEEGVTAEHVRTDSRDAVLIPRVRWDLTTSRVLTMEFLEGVSLLTVCKLAESGEQEKIGEILPGIDLLDVLTDLAEESLRQMFVSGLFHGDPHPGNILVSVSGRPVMLDFGIFGRLSSHTRSLLAQFYESLAFGNVAAAFRYYARISHPTPDTNYEAYRQEFIASLQRWYELTNSMRGTVQERHPLRFVSEIIGVMRRHAVRMPADQLLFWRALTTLASLAVRVPVRFDLLATMRRFFERLQPTMTERVIELFTDCDRTVAIADLGRNAGSYAGSVLDHATGGAGFSARVEHSFESRAIARSQAAWIALALPAVSLSVIAALGTSTGARVAAAAIAASLLVTVARKSWRRSWQTGGEASGSRNPVSSGAFDR